jgi:hypothetical protein
MTMSSTTTAARAMAVTAHPRARRSTPTAMTTRRCARAVARREDAASGRLGASTPGASSSCSVVARASMRSGDDGDDDGGGTGRSKPSYSNETKLRSEAQAPFRVARQFLYGACGASATIGTGIATIQLLTKLAGAPSAPPIEGTLENLAIDVTALAVFAFLYTREEKAKEKQMARIGREERLGRLRLELAGGRSVRLEDLRGFSRAVIVSGDGEYLRDAIGDAERVREELVKRGVLVIPVPTTASADVPTPAAEDRKFRATPLRVNEWLEWVREQKSMAKVGDDKGVYVGLRMDGRVRSSGTGRVPFERFSVELPPVDSWGGALDGFDGRVGVDS